MNLRTLKGDKAMKKNKITEDDLREIISNDWFCDLINEDIVPYLFISNDVWYDDGFDTFCLPETKADFYNMVQQVLDIIMNFADKFGENNCYIGPFHNVNSYEHWANKEQFDCFNELKKHIKNDDYLSVDIAENKELIGLIIENNFRYLSQISMCFPKTQILVRPTHHTEVIVYSREIDKFKDTMAEIVNSNGWKLIERT